jgi:hypothetical protein
MMGYEIYEIYEIYSINWKHFSSLVAYNAKISL